MKPQGRSLSILNQQVASSILLVDFNWYAAEAFSLTPSQSTPVSHLWSLDDKLPNLPLKTCAVATGRITSMLVVATYTLDC